MKLYLAYSSSTSGGEVRPGQEDEDWPEYNDMETDWDYINLSIEPDPKVWSKEEIEVDFEAVKGQEVWMVHVRYATGNTFGRHRGCWRVLGVYNTVEKAKSVVAEVDNGTHQDRFVWTGYFENLESRSIDWLVIQ